MSNVFAVLWEFRKKICIYTFKDRKIEKNLFPIDGDSISSCCCDCCMMCCSYGNKWISSCNGIKFISWNDKLMHPEKPFEMFWTDFNFTLHEYTTLGNIDYWNRIKELITCKYYMVLSCWCCEATPFFSNIFIYVYLR